MSDITINGKNLEEHLLDEKAQEMKDVVYDIHIQITKSRYHKPTSRPKNSRGRSGKVKVVDSKEDIFLIAFDGLKDQYKDLMANASNKEQDIIWRKWNRSTYTGVSLSDTLKAIIKEVCHA